MAWKERTVEHMREEFVRRVLAQEKSKAALCREYGISRPTGDKWLERFQNKEPLRDQSRAPKTIPNRTSQEMEDAIVALRRKYPAIGAVKLRRMMKNQGYSNLPCARTFNNIFHRYNLIEKEASQAATPYQRFERAAPNEMWQADFKGHFAMKDGFRCHPLNILDDYTRFNLCVEALLSETYSAVQPVLERLFREYGRPQSLLCDNGTPWGTSQSAGFTHLEVWLMELDILTLHGRPLHPQTQGKEERFNRSFTRECLRQNEFLNISQSQDCFNRYRSFYNNERPHYALDMAVPASKYHPSSRLMPKRIEPWEYGPEYTLHKVKSSGYISYRGQGYYLSEALGDKTIAIRESHLPGQVTLVFRNFKIARIDLDNRVFTLRKAYRLDNDPRQKV